MNIYVSISLKFLRVKNISDKFVQKIEIHILFPTTFPKVVPFTR